MVGGFGTRVGTHRLSQNPSVGATFETFLIQDHRVVLRGLCQAEELAPAEGGERSRTG